jgi:hypothetical protein
MIGLLVDNNIAGHGRLLWQQFSATDWNSLQISSLMTLDDSGLPLGACNGFRVSGQKVRG